MEQKEDLKLIEAVEDTLNRNARPRYKKNPDTVEDVLSIILLI